MRTGIEALQALRGVAQIAAATIVAELGEVSRFAAPRQLMGYSGMVAKEHSSGQRIWRGGITKTGNAHLRRVVTEAAWAYRHRPSIGGLLRKRQEKLSEEVKEIAWKAQHRLHARYRRLTGRGKSKQQVVTAIGRELLGVVGFHLGHWSTSGIQGARTDAVRSVTLENMRTWEAVKVAVEGHTERRTLQERLRWPSGRTRAVSPRQLYEYQSDQPSQSYRIRHLHYYP